MGHRFVNGYYKKKAIQEPTWENTRVDHNEMTVEMYGLNTSHNGVYVCIIQYNNEEVISEVNINFTVTGKNLLNTKFKNVDLFPHLKLLVFWL